MAATAANTEYLGIGGPGGKWLYSEITLDSAYAVGGETITAATFGLQFFKAVFVADNEDGFMYDLSLNAAKTILTIKVWVFGSASTSAAQPYEGKIQDLSAVVLPVLIRGI